MPNNTKPNLGGPTLYQEFLAQRAEILKHKWIESEKAGHDIGFERALTEWMTKYRHGWLQRRQGTPNMVDPESPSRKDISLPGRA
ncbi:MAG: DUF4032 domain-containing protein [Verrucomicrobiae bacterium]|nr:DUF4032 domain-containing protein [Verrucomicrobiae bacterium]